MAVAPPQIIFTVTNDLTYDQRMQRICSSLAKVGYSVLLVGRELPGSLPLDEHPYRQVRLKCRFNEGKLFYGEYNWLLRRFLSAEVEKLIQNHPSIAICAIDLDTILPCLRVSKKYNLLRVYDAHELFTELTEVKRRTLVYKIWQRIEQSAVPQFQHGYSVNQFIVDELKRRYNVEYEVIRNLPKKKDDRSQMTADRPGSIANPEFPIPDSPFFLYQGAVNEGRSFETLIPAMKMVNASLVIAGDGNFFEQAKQLAAEHKVEDKVIFLGYVKPADLKQLTPKAFAGITLFENTGLNQYYSLANRFFDYINGGIPQLCVDYPEYAVINQRYETALLTNNLSPGGISNALNKLLEDPVLYKKLKDNCAAAANELCWEKEEEKLLNFWNAILPIKPAGE